MDNLNSKNYGLLLEPLQPEDYVFGSAQSLSNKFKARTKLRPDSDWRPWLPVEEPQAPIYETNACASFGTNNALEILLRFQYDRTSDFSDRDVAKGSGTDPFAGNSPKRVADFIRTNWALFEQEWPANAAKNVFEFYADVPLELRQLAKGRGAEWDFGYEYVNTGSANIREALKYSPLGMSVPAWTADQDGKYFRPSGMNDNHWVAAVAINTLGEIVVFDTYAPYIKTMRADFTPQVAMSYYLTRQIVSEKSWVQYLIDLVLAVFKPATLLIVPPPTPPAPTAAQRLADAATAAIGKDVTPDDKIPDEVACVASLVSVIPKDFGLDANLTYTPALLSALKANPKFKAVLDPQVGTVVVTPTVGTNTGHCGIYVEPNAIASNNSFGPKKGLWTVNYNRLSWRQYFVTKKGLKTFLFHPI